MVLFLISAGLENKHVGDAVAFFNGHVTMNPKSKTFSKSGAFELLGTIAVEVYLTSYIFSSMLQHKNTCSYPTWAFVF